MVGLVRVGLGVVVGLVCALERCLICGVGGCLVRGDGAWCWGIVGT